MPSSDTAQLASLFVESVFYGVYLVTFGYCLQALFRTPSGWKRPDKIKFVPLFVALSLFCTGTINLVFGFYQILDVQEHRVSNVGYLGKPWVNIVKTSTITVEVLIADGALIYRCWQVYEKTWKFVLFPLALWATALGVAIYMQWTEYMILYFHESRLIRAFDLECISFWVITIVLNIYATGMIVFRICQADKMIRFLRRSEYAFSAASTEQRPTKLQDVTRIVIDSGLMYTATSFAVFCSQVASGNSNYITTAADMMVIGIAFNLINIRVAKAQIPNPNNTDPKTLTMIEFNHDLSLAAHVSQQISSHSSRVNPLSRARHVENSVKESAENII